MCNSLNWKHWKDINMEDDIDNVKIELVDIWHFIMSAHIAECGIDKAIDESIKISKRVNKLDWDIKLFDSLEAIIKKSLDKKIPIREFFIAMLEVEDFQIEDVYRLYIGKNCLNQFRQDNGYKGKKGSYKKIWNGEEDNVYMMACVNNLKTVSYEQVYMALDIEYKKVLNKR